MKKKINIIPDLLNYRESGLLWSKGDGYVMFKCVRKVGKSDFVVAMDSSLSEILYDAYGSKIGAEDNERKLFLLEKEYEESQAVQPSEVRFCIAVLKPYDKVLIQQGNGMWFPDIMRGWLLSENRTDWHIFMLSGNISFDRIIPYNDETKHLAFTSHECPKFYRYWENVTNTNVRGDTPKVNKFKAWFSHLFRKNN